MYFTVNNHNQLSRQILFIMAQEGVINAYDFRAHGDTHTLKRRKLI